MIAALIPELTVHGFMQGSEWIVLSILAVMVAFLLNTIIWMFAHAFNAQELERGAKAEMLQSAATAFMIIFIVFMLNSMQDFAIYQFFGSPDSTVDCGGESIALSQLKAEGDVGAIAVVKCRMMEQAVELAHLQKEVYEGLEGTFSGNTPFNVFGALSIYSSVLAIPVFQGTYVDAWYSAAESYRLLNYLTTSFLIGLNALIVFIDYISQNMLEFYLPVGLILRSFQPTRGIGAFFIALALGMYFIYPVLFVVTDPGFQKVDISLQKPNPAKPELCYPTFSGASTIMDQQTQAGQDLSANLGSIKAGVMIFQKIYTVVMLRPFIILAITLIFVRYMMFLLGGEPYEIMRAVAKMV
jgi:hypothetical protein